MHYDCVKCGRGCEDFERITVATEVLAQLEALHAAALVQDGHPEMSFVSPDPKPPGGHILRKVIVDGKRERSACCFLRGDKLCAIHCEHGLEVKPGPCQSFPFGFTATPDGVYSGLSFACTAVLDDHGPAIVDQRADVERTLTFSPVRTTMDRLVLTSGIPITWDQYSQIEGDLIEILSLPRPIESRVVAQSVYLQLLVRLLQDARLAAAADWDEHPEANDDALRVFRRRMRTENEDSPWSPLLRLAARPAQTRMLRRVFLGFSLAFRRACSGRMNRFGAMLHVMTAYWAYAIGRGGLDVPRLSKPGQLSRMRAVAFDANTPEYDRLLTRYLRHCIGRKDLLVRDSVRFGHNMLLMNYGLVHWHATAFAADAGRERVALEDLKEAVRAVEQYFGYHSQFASFFNDYPAFKRLMESMFQRPVYAMAMARPEF